jgi:hypothetical protein
MQEDPIRALYAVMCDERINIDVLFVPLDDGTPVINIRFREWKKGNATDRMVLAAGRSLDEALVYAYKGLTENVWLPMDWSARAYEIGIVNMLARPHLPVRQPLPFDRLFKAIVEAPNGKLPDDEVFGDPETSQPRSRQPKR